MSTYEKHFENRSETEIKDPYYTHIQDEVFCRKVLEEFGANGTYSVIVNGHTPVRVKDGEVPTSGNGRHITIDGGLSHAYYSKTGIGGYTLIGNSQGLYLVSHIPFSGESGATENDEALRSEICTLKTYEKRILIKETDKGKELFEQIQVLKRMLKNYF